MCLVFAISLSLLNREMIPEYIEYLQILEFGLLIGASTEIGDDFLEGADLVVANGEDIELGAVVKPIQDHYLVVVEGEISEIHQIIESLYH